MTKIALVIPYYGSFATDIDFWIKSVSFNPSIDFLLFTDLQVPTHPSNLKVISNTFEETVSIIQSLFDFKICIPNAYKFCDFRPCFGEAFAQYLVNYDFWGYTDTDMVYGDIRSYITEELLSRYDRILARGHFSIFRNCKEVNSIYKKILQPQYKQVFTSPCGWAFDEYWGTSRYWDLEMNDRFYQAILFDDIDCNHYSFSSHMRKMEDKGKRNFIYSFERGKLYRIYEQNDSIHKDETMYVHFQKRNMKVNVQVGDEFMMIPNAYVEYDENITLEKLRAFNIHKCVYVHKYKLQFNRIKAKFLKLKASIYAGEFGCPKLPKDAWKYYQ